jgi:ubiquinone/menaquinone biosynthesis C-methylase UbiE/uncharacterized protein YbaR (Trm112 family)
VKISWVKRLRCPGCGAEGLDAHPFEVSGADRIRTGVLSCGACRSWFPISDHLTDLLPEVHADPGSRTRFFERNRARLEELGLHAPSAAAPDPGFDAQEHQREHFDDLARRRDRFSYDALGRMPFQRAIRDLNFAEWAPRIPPGARVLDIGCADGLSTFDMARHDVELLGIDISREQLGRAQERADRTGTDNVSFVIGDADSLPLATGAVDCVLCYGSLHHVPRPERTVGEMARVLEEGGSYLGVENNTTPLRPIFDALMRLRPIWLEEAGAEAQIGARDLDRWSEGTGLEMDTRTIVFVPPQLCNLLGYRVSRTLLRATDWLFRRLPGARRWGGLLFISASRVASGKSPGQQPSALRAASEARAPTGR